MKDTILDYFLKYVKIDTMSMEDQNVTPSTQKQFDLIEPSMSCGKDFTHI